MLKISIILPVYNVSATIERMLDSINAQTLNNFEVLMVDDGCTDRSGEILDEYAAKDTRFKVFHKRNEGVAMARQLGMDNAKGEYCIHADADDWMEPTMLEDLYMKAKAENADVVIADYYLCSGKDDTLCKQQPSHLSPEQLLQDMFANKLFGALWHKLVRTGLYKKYNVRFFNGINHCEDLLIWVQLLQHTEIKVAYLPKAYYHYVVNDASITRHFTRQTYNMRLMFCEKLSYLLHVPNAKSIIEKVSFGIFVEGFIYSVLTREEIKQGLRLYKSQITVMKSKKWKLGFCALRMGMYDIAHMFIHY